MKRLFWVCLCAMVAAISGAQQDLFHRPSPLAGRTLLTLSLFEEVRTELKITPDEASKIDALPPEEQADLTQAMRDANGDFDSFRPTVEKINVKYDASLVTLLTLDQNARLKQLFVQFNGAAAVSNPFIQADLAISADQKAKISAAQDENYKKLRESVSHGEDPDETKQAMSRSHDELSASLAKILTDDQRAKLKTMEGSKFEFQKISSM